jgi:hypothetical protein
MSAAASKIEHKSMQYLSTGMQQVNNKIKQMSKKGAGNS